MSDLIDRQAAHDTLTEYYHHKTDAQHIALAEALSRVPSAPRWIPVTEKLPERYGAYLVTMEDMVDEWGDTDEDDKVQVRWYHKGYGFDDGDEYAVLAWMPLPEPYKGEEE